MSDSAAIDPRLPQIDDCLYRISIKAVIIQNRKLLLVHERDDEWWSVPGGGIDYGETVEQAIRRELSEELGVDPQDVHYDASSLFLQIGAVVNGVPRANLFYRVHVPVEAIKLTEHVIEHKWCSATEIAELYTSPSTGDVIKELANSMEGEYDK
jgi:8-oxo-dGTP diphosphatase